MWYIRKMTKPELMLGTQFLSHYWVFDMSVVDAVDVVVIATSISDGMFEVIVVFAIAEKVILGLQHLGQMDVQ